jgi:hypothetical protein
MVDGILANSKTLKGTKRGVQNAVSGKPVMSFMREEEKREV